MIAVVVHDDQGKAYSVRYEAVNAMLLNEFLKKHRKVEKLEALVAQQQKDFQSRLAEQQKMIQALAARVSQVSERVEASHPAARLGSQEQ